MKKISISILVFIFLITFVFFAGCNGDTPTPPDEVKPGGQPISPATPNSAPQVTAPISRIPVESSSMCGELVYCGIIKTSTITQPITSTNCEELNKLGMRRDRQIRDCFRVSFTGDGANGRSNGDIEFAKYQCGLGIGSRKLCEEYGVPLVR